MNTCPRCGAPTKPLSSEKFVCEFCGESILIKKETPKVENIVQEQPMIQREVVYVREESNIEDNLGCWMWGVCFCIPIVGVVLYFKYKSDDSYRKANSALTAAIISFVISFIIGIVAEL